MANQRNACLTPEARDFLSRELGEEWLDTHNFYCSTITLSDAEKLLPWLRENYKREKERRASENYAV
jgi:hypothetical protein